MLRHHCFTPLLSSAWMPAFPAIFGLCAMFASIWSNFSCNSVKYEPNSDFDLNTIIPLLPSGVTLGSLPDPLPNIEVGLWGYKGLAAYQVSFAALHSLLL